MKRQLHPILLVILACIPFISSAQDNQSHRIELLGGAGFSTMYPGKYDPPYGEDITMVIKTRYIRYFNDRIGMGGSLYYSGSNQNISKRSFAMDDLSKMWGGSIFVEHTILEYEAFRFSAHWGFNVWEEYWEPTLTFFPNSFVSSDYILEKINIIGLELGLKEELRLTSNLKLLLLVTSTPLFKEKYTVHYTGDPDPENQIVEEDPFTVDLIRQATFMLGISYGFK